MSFFTKVKNFLGIGGVKVSLQVPGQISKEEKVVQGKVNLTAKSDQHLLSFKVILFEEFTSGRGDDEKTRRFELGEYKVDLNEEMQAGTDKTIAFELPFKILKSSNEELSEKGGMLGGLGKLAKFADNEKSAYFIEAEVDVKGTALDPSDRKEVAIV